MEDLVFQDKQERCVLQDKQERLAGEGLPPYVSYRQWNNLLDSLATFIPSRFDSSYFESISVSTTCRSMLRAGLWQVFDFVSAEHCYHSLKSYLST